MRARRSDAAETPVFVGTAGWSIRRDHEALFAPGESHLSRYAACFNAVEINSSFHRPHRVSTYERWAASVPECFRFACKLPRTITHDLKLTGCDDALARFLDESGGLGAKRGPLLVQLPPKGAFDRATAERFFAGFRDRYDGALVCEPRHESWFAEDAEALLVAYRVGRVAADPARVAGAERPGGWTGIVYVRLHGSPRIYYSRYTPEFVAGVAALLRGSHAAERWCIFDNTTLGEAAHNAVELDGMLNGEAISA